MKYPLTVDSFKIESPVMLKIYEEVDNYSEHKSGFVLFGPSGSGKEFIAKTFFNSLHEKHKDVGEFYSLNCAAFSRELLISELFGHVQGAFTGAIKDKEGIFEEAKGGVVFLDEIGDMPADVQNMLLKALDKGNAVARKLGSNIDYPVEDVIVIAATDKDPSVLSDPILYRLGFRIFVPPMEKRTKDIPHAINHFVSRGFKKRRDMEELCECLLGTGFPKTRPEDKCIDEKKLNEEQQEALKIRRKKLEAKQYKVLEKFAESFSDKITPQINVRDWKGNFRNLRIVMDYAMLQIRDVETPESFISAYLNYVQQIIDKYSIRKDLSIPDTEIKHEELPETTENTKELEKLNEFLRLCLPSVKHEEINLIGQFLLKSKGFVFNISDYLAVVKVAKQRTAQTRLKTLVEFKVLNRTPKRPFLYNLLSSEMFIAPVRSEAPEKLVFREAKSSVDLADTAIENINLTLNNGFGIFLKSTNVPYRNDYCLAVGNALRNQRTIFYYSFEKGSIEDLVESISKDIPKSKSVRLEGSVDPVKKKIISLSGPLWNAYLASHKPVLILGDIESLNSANDLDYLQTIIMHWSVFSIIVSGSKMPVNNDILTEIPIGDPPK